MSSRARILVIDDDPLFRSLIVSLLRREYVVAVAADGAEGFYKALEHPPAVAVIDIQMPGWDGIKTLRAFRSHPALCDVRTMMLTADASQGTVMAAIQGGAHDYVVKSSFSHEDFCRKLGRLLPDAADAPAGGERSVPVGGRGPGTSRILERVPLPASADAAGGDAAHERLQQIIDAWE
jgi:two-component system OmpR family response regulator